MTWLPGRVRHERLGPTAISAWAGLAASVHRQAVSATERPPIFTFRGPVDLRVPGWARWPDLWRQAIDLRTAGPPPTPYRLLHRDFHLGNSLWQRRQRDRADRLGDTSWGPADLDVAHACSDFAMLHSIEDAEAFQAAYRRHGGQLDPDPDAARFGRSVTSSASYPTRLTFWPRWGTTDPTSPQPPSATGLRTSSHSSSPESRMGDRRTSVFVPTLGRARTRTPTPISARREPRGDRAEVSKRPSGICATRQTTEVTSKAGQCP